MLLSGLIRTYNEQLNLPKSLDNLFHFCDEVVISDGGSTDSTKSIAEAYQRSGHNITWLDFPGGSISDKVHFNHPGRQFEFGYQHCKGDWVITNDVDIIHCDRIRADLRTILSETDHDAFLMYGVHIVKDWAHYAADLGAGPGLVQLWKRKPGIHFPDRTAHVATITHYPWDNLGILFGGLYHWGYLDREAERAKLKLRHIAMPEDETYKALAEKLQERRPAPIPWEDCHANCTKCWMEQLTVERMVVNSAVKVAQVKSVLDITKSQLEDAKTTRDRALKDLVGAKKKNEKGLIEALTKKIAYCDEQIEALPKRIAEIKVSLGATERIARAMMNRAVELGVA